MLEWGKQACPSVSTEEWEIGKGAVAHSARRLPTQKARILIAQHQRKSHSPPTSEPGH